MYFFLQYIKIQYNIFVSYVTLKEIIRIFCGIFSPCSPWNTHDICPFEWALIQVAKFASIDFRGKHKREGGRTEQRKAQYLTPETPSVQQ